MRAKLREAGRAAFWAAAHVAALAVLHLQWREMAEWVAVLLVPANLAHYTVVPVLHEALKDWW